MPYNTSMKTTSKSNQQPVAPTLLIAPFRGITIKAYRNALAKHMGHFKEAYAPFISGLGEQKTSTGKLSDILPYESNLSPTVPQIIGNNAREIIAFARALEDAGFDHLNWNLGCPFARIANKKRGCGMLPYPEEIDHILQEVFTTINIGLSIKMRLGYRNESEIRHVMPVLNKFPLKHIVLHPRTGIQVYKGHANPAAFVEASRLSSHELIYNGDIYNRHQFIQLQHMMPQIRSWMLGRGVLINPFLPSEIMGVSFSELEKKDRLIAFHNELWSFYADKASHEKRSLGMMKAIWHYMAGIFSNARDVFLKIRRATNEHAYYEAIAYAIDQPLANDRELEAYFRQLTTKL